MLCCLAVFKSGHVLGTMSSIVDWKAHLDGWAEDCNVFHHRYELSGCDVIDGWHGVAHHHNLGAQSQKLPDNREHKVSADK